MTDDRLSLLSERLTAAGIEHSRQDDDGGAIIVGDVWIMGGGYVDFGWVPTLPFDTDGMRAIVISAEVFGQP